MESILINKMTSKLGKLGSLILLCIFTSHSAFANSNCYNFGVYDVNVIDKKNDTGLAGDLKDLKVKYDYDNNVFRIKFTYNRVPNSKQTTGINIGFTNGTECTSVNEYYKTKGFTKKITRDYENNSYEIEDFNWVGNLKLITSTKNSLTLDWFGPQAYIDDRLTEHCVKVSVTQPGTFYRSGINCVTTGPFTNCTGPGYVNGTVTIDEQTNWAKSKSARLDVIQCGLEKSSYIESIPTPKPSTGSTTSFAPNSITDFSGIRNSAGVEFKFSKPINVSSSNLINYELGIQYLKSPNIDSSVYANYSEITMLQFSKQTNFYVSYIEIKDWLKAAGIDMASRSVMFKVRTNVTGGISSQWSNGIYLLANEYST